MAIDDEMPLACEELAGVVHHKDTMGICCFGEQGMNSSREAMHGNLMFGALLFSQKPSRLTRNFRGKTTSQRYKEAAGAAKRRDSPPPLARRRLHISDP